MMVELGSMSECVQVKVVGNVKSLIHPSSKCQKLNMCVRGPVLKGRPCGWW